MKSIKILLILGVVFAGLISILWWIEYEYGDDIKEMYADCPECLNNTVLQETCNSTNKTPECVHYRWCVTLNNVEGCSK